MVSGSLPWVAEIHDVAFAASNDVKIQCVATQQQIRRDVILNPSHQVSLINFKKPQ